jgi:hypothetical protein
MTLWIFYYYYHCILELSIVIQTSNQSFCISPIDCDKTIRMIPVHKTDACVLLILMYISLINRDMITRSIEHPIDPSALVQSNLTLWILH